MNREWNDTQPIYRQLRDRGVHMILDGVLNEGDPLPSVRTVAAEFRVNPLTVLKAYQQLVDENLVEMKRGLGMFVKPGARDQLLKGERQKFLTDEWPRIAEKIERLGLTQRELDAAAARRSSSKGMVAQLHLAIVMAIDARLLVLDEPTLGLDILYRKQFYDSLLNDYFDRSRTIIVTTHQVEEVQDVLTDLMFIDRGRIVLECSMEEFDSRYLEVMVNPEHLAAARALKPMHERPVFGRSVLLFDRVDR